jgi:hypothetical protein
MQGMELFNLIAKAKEAQNSSGAAASIDKVYKCNQHSIETMDPLEFREHTILSKRT